MGRIFTVEFKREVPQQILRGKKTLAGDGRGKVGLGRCPASEPLVGSRRAPGLRPSPKPGSRR
jgi:hypothetical protein